MKSFWLGVLVISSVQASPFELVATHTGDKWERDTFPIGNGSLGACLYGAPGLARMQFTVDSFWMGNENARGAYNLKPNGNSGDHFGAHQNMGELIFTPSSTKQISFSNPSGDQSYNNNAPESFGSVNDGDPKTKWCVPKENIKGLIWQVDAGKPTLLKSYSLTSANDAPERDPIAWTVEGSKDGEKWQTVDQRKDQAPAEKRLQSRSFSLKKPAEFRYYRIRFSARPEASHFQLGDIELAGLSADQAGQDVSRHRRVLNLQTAVHSTTWTQDGHEFKREAIASHPAGIVAWKFSTDHPDGFNGSLTITGTHGDVEKLEMKGSRLQLVGQLPNQLRYAAGAEVITKSGKVSPSGSAFQIQASKEFVVHLAATTNYVADRKQGWMTGDPVEKISSQLSAARGRAWSELLAEHSADHRQYFDRVSLDLGTTPDEIANLPLKGRIQRYRDGAKERPRPCLDPDLEEIIFHYGRYLLIASSRQGTLPANLQGIWNDSNKPAWMADFHSNINLQMNYWLAENTNLAELANPLFDLLDSGKEVYAEHTRKQYGADKPGFVTRMSINPFGGTGWNWNIEGTAWLAQHYWMHYFYGRDREFLEKSAYPFLRDVSKFWLTQLKTLPDGRLVVPNAWSHEHGPHEDGTAHAQQLMWDLFSNTIAAATELKTDPAFVAKLKETRSKLVGPKIGSWGQLMEWMEEKPDLEKSNHRHTSHLYAIHPGNQITLTNDPKLAEAARVSLEKRGEVGDSRRSWTWAWRTALWARLGQPERAHDCVAGLLAYNTLDNLWTTHPPFQIDGNLGISSGIAEMLLQGQSGKIQLLPALPKAWPTGSVTGLRAPGEVIVDLKWQDGRLTSAKLSSPLAQSVEVILPGSTETLTLELPKDQAISVPLKNK